MQAWKTNHFSAFCSFFFSLFLIDESVFLSVFQTVHFIFSIKAKSSKGHPTEDVSVWFTMLNNTLMEQNTHCFSWSSILLISRDVKVFICGDYKSDTNATGWFPSVGHSSPGSSFVLVSWPSVLTGCQQYCLDCPATGATLRGASAPPEA